MALTRIKLSDDEARRLDELASRRGTTPEELAYDAVAGLLADSDRDARLARMRAARGLWANRDDLPELRTLRAEWDHDGGRDSDG